ncbi:MAG: class I SAM-dependent methyltransferase [Candidatus Nanopelagicales bacterium]|nr:class I SAM-dependent methyltransferase [Candidatus Nanopelagicales bacterium]
MGVEIDLLADYPKANRDLQARSEQKSEADRAIARQFGQEFFDGDRRHGYGGFNYQPRFWQPVIPAFQRHFGLGPGSSVLDVGCAKGFMLHDMAELIPCITVRGIDISQYAIDNAIEDVRPFLQVADAKSLPFDDDSFDVVFSINTVHNLARDECGQALREIERVSKRGSFVTLDAYRDEGERERMLAWNLTGQTIMATDEWVRFFGEVGYSGDYYWFIP